MIIQNLTDSQIDFDGSIINYESLSETLTIPATANFPSGNPSRYVIELTNNILVDGSHAITISGYSRKTSPSPGSGEFYIYPYTTATDNAPLAHLIEFNVADAGNSVTVNYYGIGSPITKSNLNTELTYAVQYSRQLSGLTLSNNGTDANNDIDIAAGGCIDSTGVEIMTVSAITKRLDAAWAVGTNQGGLDTSSKANSTWYYLYVIKRIDTNVTDVLFSTNATSPTMPTNYSYFRKIGAVVTDGSGNIIGFYETFDRWFWFKSPVADISTTTLSTSRVDYAITAPPLSMVYMQGNAIHATASYVYISNTLLTDVAPGTANSSAMSPGNTTGINWEGFCNGSSQISARASASSTTLRLQTRGFKVDL